VSLENRRRRRRRGGGGGGEGAAEEDAGEGLLGIVSSSTCLRWVMLMRRKGISSHGLPARPLKIEILNPERETKP